jgi:trimethylamine-N-oxide reductase (cytochrome c)
MMIGAEEEANWFAEVVLEAGRIGWRWGTDVGHGEVRYTNHTNGGPVFVYVKDQKIVRVTPIDFTDDDAGTWTIEARGRKFSPPRKTSLAPHGLASKSLI